MLRRVNIDNDDRYRIDAQSAILSRNRSVSLHYVYVSYIRYHMCDCRVSILTILSTHRVLWAWLLSFHSLQKILFSYSKVEVISYQCVNKQKLRDEVSSHHRWVWYESLLRSTLLAISVRSLWKQLTRTLERERDDSFAFLRCFQYIHCRKQSNEERLPMPTDSRDAILSNYLLWYEYDQSRNQYVLERFPWVLGPTSTGWRKSIFSDENADEGVQPLPFTRMTYPITLVSPFVVSVTDSAVRRPKSSSNTFSFWHRVGTSTYGKTQTIFQMQQKYTYSWMLMYCWFASTLFHE